MKKILLKSMIITTLVFSLAGCSKVKYTEEFNYLPGQKGMELEGFEKADKNQSLQKDTATYTVKGSKADNVMNDYLKNLEKDGWEITEDNRPTLIKAKKGEHKVIIVAVQEGDNVTLTVVSE